MKENKLYGDGDFSRCNPESHRLGTKEYRTDFRRDYARLLHSPAFRRLQGKTQLFPGDESDFFRNRLTHSLEVAQIAKAVALRFNSLPKLAEKNLSIDTDLVEFAALAHDLGHPPFGHNGEEALDECMKSFGGFEGNAQTLRILAKVEKKLGADGKAGSAGLNLTYRSLAAILKYDEMILPCREKGSKISKGYYESEKSLVESIKKSVAGPEWKGDMKTIECSIMDIADDIAYSTYDLEDTFKAGFLSPLKIVSIISTNSEVSDEIVKRVRDKIPGFSKEDLYEVVADLFSAPTDQAVDFAGYDLAYAAKVNVWSDKVAGDGYYRGAFTSELVNEFIGAVTLNSKASNPKFWKAEFKKDIFKKVETLKNLTFVMTIMSSKLKVVEYRGFDIVTEIFNSLAEDGGWRLLPEDVRIKYASLEVKSEKMRIICDFVASMTDRYAVEFYGRIRSGASSIFKPL